MQHSLLQRYAPNATALVYRPHDTGNPGQDFARHLSLFEHRRIDIENTILVGDSIVVRIEPDLAPADSAQGEARIVSVPYAERQLGSNQVAVDFIRYVKTIAGEDARGRDRQIIASHYYDELKRRAAQAELAAETDEERTSAFATAVEDVLMEMSLWAVRLEAVTMTSDQKVGGCDDLVTSDPFRFAEAEMTLSERRTLSMERAAEVLSELESTTPFHDELRFITSRKCNSNARGLVHDEEVQFQSYLRDLADHGADDSLLEATQASHERVVEQYDEKGVVSLHMGDGERAIVVGTIDDDIDDSYRVAPKHGEFPTRDLDHPEKQKVYVYPAALLGLNF